MLLPVNLLLSANLLFAVPDKSPLDADSIKADITYLASDALQGRGSGTAGNETAARYIANAFRKAGLKPLGSANVKERAARLDNSGFYQPFEVPGGVQRGRNNRLEVAVSGKTVRYVRGVDFEPYSLSRSGEVQGELVFTGYGIRSQSPARDDYAGVDVRNKIVLVLAGDPDAPAANPLAGVRAKAQTARDQGASALLIVPQGDGIVPPLSTTDTVTTDAGIPVLVVKRPVAGQWTAAAGKTLKQAEEEARRGGSPFATGVSVALAADVQKVTKTTANIAGFLEGSDPILKKEVIVIGAHMDHLGMGGPGSLSGTNQPAIHHGADDNASGTAGVLALARYYAAQPTRPKRSLLFVCFSGEEMGLLGSAHYVKHPLVPLPDIVMMLNMDMIGRMEKNTLIVGGSGTSPDWNTVLDAANDSVKLTLSRSESGFGASDHQSFYLAKIPVLFLFTGLHSDYHRPSDTADKINAPDEARVVQFAAACVDRIAALPARPVYVATNNVEQAPRPRARVSLGSIPDYAAQVEGVALSGVRPGSPAEKAGLKAGDIIIKFGERSIRSVEEYTDALGEHKPGDEVKIVVKRGSETLTLTAVLAASSR